jgi:hypothetical protein
MRIDAINIGNNPPEDVNVIIEVPRIWPKTIRNQRSEHQL